jgi:ABC-2 type transport system permease protein
MTATTTTAPAAAHIATDTSGLRVTFGRLLRSEQIKLWTVRSTPWVLGTTALVLIGVTALGAGTIPVEAGDGKNLIAYNALSTAVFLSQLAIAVVGVLTITGEYSTGMIRSSLSAAPRRTPVLTSKLVVLFLTVVVAAAIAVAVAVAVATAILNSRGPGFDLGNAEAQRVVAGSVLYLATVAALAFAIGALFRHSAAALATVLGLLLVIENLFFIPWKPLSYLHPFLPGTAGRRLTMSEADIAALNDQMRGPDFTAWQGYGVLVAWVVVLLAIAIWRLKKRDA